ncbi:uncharacterized protein LOC111387520 [Olea europaea var. sylvestris]|uniref:Stress induced protein n=1 Tax=Olea europaea subsp. europaea TaxID=158383 RepID=A0A8S0R261_OLEEU|nr:uncharacterized protein LOC111387520 [Olea europaea var. sylvestris]CAA2972152.1 Hypothetical predicted protein [Olea europaea subsp. europaea]
MAASQQKQGFISTYSPIIEREHEADDDNDVNKETPSAGGCAFFRSLCFGWNGENEGDESHLLQGGEVEKETWLVKKLKKLKEFSEVVAGPKWKNFIRKIGKLCNAKKSKTQFQYSPESYALNFNGEDDDDEEDYHLVHSFSARFAPQAFNDQQNTAVL